MKDRLRVNKKNLKIIGIAVILLALPMTLYTVYRIQNTASRAAAPDKLETESGVLSSSGVTKQSDSNASGGQFILFNTDSSPPLESNYLASCTTLDKDNWPSRIYPPPSIPLPGYLESVQDPTTGVKIIRISGDPGDPIPNTNNTWSNVCGPHYPKTPAWNADQSVLFMQNNCGVGGFLYWDAKDGPDQYNILFARFKGNEGRWHPIYPNIMVYVEHNFKIVGFLDIYTGKAVKKYEASENNFTKCGFGGGAGKLSDDGRYIVLMCEDSNLPKHSDTRPGMSFFVVDLISGERASPVITSWEMPNFAWLDEVIISPSGTMIIPQESSARSVTLGFDKNDWWFMHEGTWALGHYDVGYDSQKNEIAMDGEGNTVNLKTGKKYQWLNVDYKQFHASLRNNRIPGWGIINNVRNNYFNMKPVFDGEIYAAESKPNGMIRRIIHHRSTGSTKSGSERYVAIPFATSSPDGTRVFFRSDWGNADGPVYAFIADIRNVCGQ